MKTKMSNITGSWITTVIGIIITAALAAYQYYHAGGISIYDGILDFGTLVIPALMNDGIFKVSPKVAIVLTEIENVEAKLMPIIQDILKAFPGKFSTEASIILGYINDPLIKKMIDELIAGGKPAPMPTPTPAPKV